MATHVDWKTVQSWAAEKRHVMFIDTMHEFDADTAKAACRNDSTMLVHMLELEELTRIIKRMTESADSSDAPANEQAAVVITDARWLIPARWLAAIRCGAPYYKDDEYEKALRDELDSAIEELKKRGVPVVIGDSTGTYGPSTVAEGWN